MAEPASFPPVAVTAPGAASAPLRPGAVRVGSLAVEVVIVSDDLTQYGEAEWAEVERARRASAAADAPPVLDAPFATRTVVRSPASSLEFDPQPSGTCG